MVQPDRSGSNTSSLGARGLQKGVGHRRNFVGYVGLYKYAVFDIKLAYNH